jgi:2-aminoadipate transaminase
MVAAVRRDLPEASMTVPHGGYYVWLTLPEDIDTDKLAEYAAEEHVTLIPGSKFYAGEVSGSRSWPKNQMRLAYSHASPEQIDEGTRRLAEALRRYRARAA